MVNAPLGLNYDTPSSQNSGRLMISMVLLLAGFEDACFDKELA